MPRIAHVISTPSGLGGAERVLAALVDEGRQRRWEQLVLNPFARSENSDLAMATKDTSYDAKDCKSLLHILALRRWVAERLRVFDPHIVHVHLFHALVVVASLPRRDRAARILTHHHGDVLRVHGQRVRQILDRYGGTRFDYVVAVSESVRRFLLSEYGYPESKVLSIPNGWSGRPPTASGLARRPTVLCAANFRLEKGHAVLLAAFRRVLAEVPDAELVLVGEGRLSGGVRERSSSLGLSDNVTFVGAVDDVWPYLERAHVFALASLYEPLGIVVMEAMAAGLPVVASAVGGIPELVRPGITGELVDANDDKAMARELVRLLRSPEMRQEMGNAARKDAASLKMDRMVDRYFGLYESVL